MNQGVAIFERHPLDLRSTFNHIKAFLLFTSAQTDHKSIDIKSFENCSIRVFNYIDYLFISKKIAD